jgi:hypothetical protein
MGILTSDSGKESILKLVLERNGLSGISLFEQDELKIAARRMMKPGFQVLNMV